MNCTTCGLLDKQMSPNFCMRFKKAIEDFSVGEDCIYFFKEKYEEGELLTPQ